VVVLGEGVARQDVVVEHASVVHDPRDQAHPMRVGRLEHQLAGPRLQRIEDDHRPIDPLCEALQAVDQVEGEAVGRAGRDAQQACEARLACRLHAVPHGIAGVADPIGVVKQQQVEALDSAALQAALGGHANVVAVVAWPAQSLVGEARKAPRAVALAVIEVVADRTDQAVAVALDPRERLPEHAVGLTGAVDVRREHRLDAGARAQQRPHPLLLERLSEVHEAPSAPGADRGRCRIHSDQTSNR
jgi:hypothetical protein